MDKKKKIVIMIGVFIAIVLLLIFIIARREKEDLGNLEIESEGSPDEIYVTMFNPKLEFVQSRNDFYIVKRIVERYYMKLSELNDPLGDIEFYETEEGFDIDEYIEELKEESARAVYSFLDVDYINQFNITTTNLLEKLGKYEDISIVIDEMHVSENSIGMSTYFVYGLIKNNDTLRVSDFVLMVTLDLNARTFSIAPYEYIVEKGYDKLTLGQEMVRGIGEIKEKSYNQYDYRAITDEKVILDYLEKYKVTVLYNRQKAYNLLDEEYRAKRFGSLAEYERYVQNNIGSINSIVVSRYLVEDKEEYKQYVIINQHRRLLYNKRGSYNAV